MQSCHAALDMDTNKPQNINHVDAGLETIQVQNMQPFLADKSIIYLN